MMERRGGEVGVAKVLVIAFGAVYIKGIMWGLCVGVPRSRGVVWSGWGAR